MSRKFTKPVVQKNCVSIGGGLLRSAVVAKLAGPGDQYIELKKMGPWLCEAAAGQPYCKAPLSRTQLIQHFKAGLKAGPDDEAPACQAPKKVDRMDSLFGDPRPKPAIAAVIKPRRPVGKNGVVHKDKAKWPECTKSLKHPRQYGGTEMYTWRLWQKSGSDTPWIHMDDLVTAIEYMHEEVKSQGVPPLEQDEAPDRGGCCWDRRDFAWYGRVTGESGDSYRKCFMVPTKSAEGVALTPEKFDKVKEDVRIEAAAWVESHKTM